MSKQVIIAPQAGRQELAFNLKVDVLIYGGSAGCYSGETEFLTPNGWVEFKDYKPGMEVAEYNKNTDTIKFVQPEKYHKIPCDILTRMEGRGLCMTLSDEHKVLFWDGYKNSSLKDISFEEVKKRHNKSKTKGWTGKIKTSYSVDNAGLGLSEGQIRLQVACKADGSFVKNGKDNYCRIRVSKKRKYDRIISLCEQFGLPYKDFGHKPEPRYKSGKHYTVIVWPESKNKRYNDWWLASQAELDIIADEVCHWDGSIVREGRSFRYFSKFKEDCDFIQHVFASQGMNTSVVADCRKESINWTTNGQLHGRGYRSFANKDRKNPLVDVPTTDGYKYCFSVDSGYLLVRDKNKVYLSGNSGKSRLLLMKPLQYLSDPSFNCVFFRRTTKALEKAGSLFPEGKKLYAPFNPKVRERDHQFQFPAGAIFSMDHLEH